MNILPDGVSSLTGVLNNEGLVVITTNATLSLNNGTPVINRGTFEVQNGNPFVLMSSAKPFFNNAGIFRKTGAPSSLAFSNVLLQCSGTLDIQAGEIQFPANTHTFTSGMRSTGSGAIRVTGATLNIDGSLNFGTPFELAAGELSGNATLSGHITLSGGLVPDALVLNGSATWSGGQLGGSLTITILRGVRISDLHRVGNSL